MKVKVATLSLLSTLFLAAPTVYAQNAANPPSAAGKSMSMREEMIAACAGKTADAPCTFTRKGETVNGTCHQRKKEMICRSSEGRRHHHGQSSSGGSPSAQ